MSEEGKEKVAMILRGTCPAPEKLRLKVGAQVMFVKNNSEMRYVNGTLGTVISCQRDCPTVRTARGDIIKAEPVQWIIEDNGKIIASVKQVPLRLAWAITVHKSQGMTLDCAEIDLSKSFEKGMGYVALSRLKSFEGLKLIGLNNMAFAVNDDILEFDKVLRQNSENICKALAGVGEKEKVELQEKYLTSILPTQKERKSRIRKVKGATALETKKYLDSIKSLKEIVEARKLKPETVISHIEELLDKKLIVKKDIEYLKITSLKPDRLEKILQAFKKSKGPMLGPVKSFLPADYTFEEIRLTRLFL